MLFTFISMHHMKNVLKHRCRIVIHCITDQAGTAEHQQWCLLREGDWWGITPDTLSDNDPTSVYS